MARARDYFINPFQTFGLGKNPFSMGASKEEEHLVNLRNKHEEGSAKYITINNEIKAVQRDAQIAAFQGAQKGAPQSYARHGGPKTKYVSTAMFPAKSMPVSDPGRLQAAPVGYEKEPWWRQSPYVSPRQPGYSIFSMKPYPW